MEDSYNVNPNSSKPPKTSSTDGSNSKTTGESEVQEGKGVVEHEVEMPYEKGDDQQEYIEQANNNTEVANESPVRDGKGMTMLSAFSEYNQDDDDDDEDDDDDPDTEIEIGDDPDETKKKIPIM